MTSNRRRLKQRRLRRVKPGRSVRHKEYKSVHKSRRRLPIYKGSRQRGGDLLSFTKSVRRFAKRL